MKRKSQNFTLKMEPFKILDFVGPEYDSDPTQNLIINSSFGQALAM